MEVPEIARKLGSTEAAIKHTLSGAMKKLRDGRAAKVRELSVARDREARRELPRIVEGCIC